MKNNKIFPWIVVFSALLVSGSAAYYSVFGIGKMFAGASTNVMIMASSLEFSKLVIASLLYSYWDKLNKFLRLYLTIACCILIMITSAGIYGFLSAAYQETSNKIETSDKQNNNLDKQKNIIQSSIKRYENQIAIKYNRINSLSDIRSRQQSTMDNLISKNQSTKSIKVQILSVEKEIEKLDNEVKIINDSLNSENEKINGINNKSLSLQTNQDIAKEIGPLKYLAKLTGKSLDQVVNYFIIALMLVFDPLAISLVISSNFLFSSLNVKRSIDSDKPSNNDNDNDNENNKESGIPDKLVVEEEPLEEVLEEDKNNIDKEELVDPSPILENPKNSDNESIKKYIEEHINPINLR